MCFDTHLVALTVLLVVTLVLYVMQLTALHRETCMLLYSCRTDKLQVEAKLHQAEEYMRHVERYCDMELPSGWQAQAKKQYDENAATIAEERKAGTARTRYSNCSVYLATDDEAVAYEIRDKYKHIHIITNNLALKTSEFYSSRIALIVSGIFEQAIRGL